MADRGGRDPGIDTLIALHGTEYEIDAGKHWVKFRVYTVPASAGRPHGIAYSLTLHDARGRRLVGFDNAHPIRATAGPGARLPMEYDHQHRLGTSRPYRYSDAMTLLEDFWQETEAVLQELGGKS
jgi:hypothetical protein